MVDFGYCLVLNGDMDKYYVYLYKNNKGSDLISEFARKATRSQKSKIARQIQYLKIYGLTKNNPSLKKLAGLQVWEMRSLGNDNLRIFCTPHRDGIMMLHITIKKSQKTSPKDISIITKRLKDLIQD